MAIQTHVNVGGSWEQAREAYVKVSGTWRFITEIWVKEAGVWEQVYFDFQVANNPSTVFSIGGTSTNNTTAVVSGGGSPYSYSWAYVSGSTVPQISNASAATVNFDIPSPGTYSATWRVTVTDAFGQMRTDDLSVEFTNF